MLHCLQNWLLFTMIILWKQLECTARYLFFFHSLSLRHATKKTRCDGWVRWPSESNLLRTWQQANTRSKFEQPNARRPTKQTKREAKRSICWWVWFSTVTGNGSKQHNTKRTSLHGSVRLQAKLPHCWAAADPFCPSGTLAAPSALKQAAS